MGVNEGKVFYGLVETWGELVGVGLLPVCSNTMTANKATSFFTFSHTFLLVGTARDEILDFLHETWPNAVFSYISISMSFILHCPLFLTGPFLQVFWSFEAKSSLNSSSENTFLIPSISCFWVINFCENPSICASAALGTLWILPMQLQKSLIFYFEVGLWRVGWFSQFWSQLLSCCFVHQGCHQRRKSPRKTRKWKWQSREESGPLQKKQV